MSDRDDDDENSDDNEEDSENEENSEEGSNEEGSADEVDKGEQVREDILILKDIFAYIDQTSKRITSKFAMEKEINRKSTAEERRQRLEELDTPDISWSQYENLDDAQRAELLEKAIMVLGQDDSRRRF